MRVYVSRERAAAISRQCPFHTGYKVKGRFVNPKIIVCKAPAFETLTASRARRHVPTTAFSRRELRTGDPTEDAELFEFGSKLPYVARVRITINGLDYGTTSGLFEYYDDELPWGTISASRGAAVPSRHRRDSFPSEEGVGGLFFDFEAVRTASSDRDAPRRPLRLRR